MSVYNYTNTAHYGFNMIDDLSFYSQDENEDHRMLVLSDLPSLNKVLFPCFFFFLFFSFYLTLF